MKKKLVLRSMHIPLKPMWWVGWSLSVLSGICSLTGGIPGTEAAVGQGVRVAEDAVAQTMVTLAQVRVPVSMVRAKMPENTVMDVLQETVEA